MSVMAAKRIDRLLTIVSLRTSNNRTAPTSGVKIMYERRCVSNILLFSDYFAKAPTERSRYPTIMIIPITNASA